MRGRSRCGAIEAVDVGSGWRRFAAKATTVAHIDPELPCSGPAKVRLQHRHGHVVAMDFISGRYMRAYGGHDRIEQPGRLADPVP